MALEYDNPFDHIVPLDEICTIRDVQSFSFEAKEISDTQAYLTQIMIPGDNLLVFAKRNESSVSAVGAWLIMNTIQRVKGKVNMPISIAVPCDMRSIIDCEKNMRNCNTDLKLTMHMKMMDKDPDYQLSCLRSQLFAQMYDRVSIGRMESSKKAWIRAGKLETIKEKIEFYGSDEGLEEIPIVSYAGSLDIGEFNDKVEAFHQHIAISGRAGILCGITYHHGMFEFNISSNLKEWDKYLDAMTLVLKEIKMPAKDLATKILQT